MARSNVPVLGTAGGDGDGLPRWHRYCSNAQLSTSLR
jgi:hypothetical protein